VQTLNQGHTLTLELYGDVEQTTQLKSSERFVLYLPTWVNANTKSVVGFFPLRETIFRFTEI
jgi:hypothetical protein